MWYGEKKIPFILSLPNNMSMPQTKILGGFFIIEKRN